MTMKKSQIPSLRKYTGSNGVHQTTGVIPNRVFVFNQTIKKIIDEVLFKHNHTKEIKL